MGSRNAVLRKRPLPIRERVEFTEEFEGWSVNFLSEHFWKIKRVMEWEDAMQEMRLLFYHCRDHYGCKIRNARHMMKIFQTSANNWIVDEAAKDTKYKNGDIMPDGTHIESMVDSDGKPLAVRMAETDNYGIVFASLMNAPIEVKEAVFLILNSPTDVLNVVGTAIRTGSKDKAANKALCEFCGLDPKECDLLQYIREFFNE